MNPRRQGDLGEASALDWLVSQGAEVYVPFGSATNYDLVADFGDGPVRVQVKTVTYRDAGRWKVALCTRGGNQSWNGIVKRFSAGRCDRLFVVAGDGRRWYIPASVVGGATSINLGGPKYAAFEVESGRPLVSPALHSATAPAG